MDNTYFSNESKQAQSGMLDKASTNFVSNKTACQMRNLILNANITITATPSQRKNQQQIEEQNQMPGILNRREKEVLDYENDVTPSKKQKFFNDSCERSLSASFNPLTSLPLSLISNGTLSVTSESSCVTIENGIPILKEINDSNNHINVDKEVNISAITVAPMAELISTNAANRIQQNSHTVDENLNSLKGTFSRGAICNSKDLNDNKEPVSAVQPQEKLSINKIILKALTDVTKESSFSKVGLIPNPNQMYFQTMLGLEIVVDSCCCSNDVPKHAEKIFVHETPLNCGQCGTDFTTNWHFYNSPLSVLCDRCLSYNEHQILKAAQTVRLAKEYTKYFHLKQTDDGTQKRTEEESSKYSKSVTNIPVEQLSFLQQQNQIFQNYMNAAGICMKDNYVSDLTTLGASIASNFEIFEAAKVVNSLDSTSTPLSRAKAVQNFQIALFQGLHQKLSPPLASSNDMKVQEQSLLYYQTVIAQMKKDANVKALQSENQSADSPLAALTRAVELQHQSLMKTILKQMSKSTN